MKPRFSKEEYIELMTPSLERGSKLAFIHKSAINKIQEIIFGDSVPKDKVKDELKKFLNEELLRHAKRLEKQNEQTNTKAST